MRYAVAALLVVHGLIHVPGFLKAWKLAELPSLSGRTIVHLSDGTLRVVGALWLLTAVGLVVAAALRLLDRDAWWMVAAPTLVLSQMLIILQWGEARAGTAANVLLGLAVVMAAGVHGFHSANDRQARALLARSPGGDAPVVRAEEVASLPPPVRRWLEGCGAVGQPRAQTVRLRQRGEMRTGPGRGFMHAEATQYFTVDQPAFVWNVDVTLAGVLPLVGRDSFEGGKGRMYITLAGLVAVADGVGPRFDQGTALRYLGEIIWFPSAALSRAISWEAIDDASARATLRVDGVEVSAVFEFDARGRFTRLTAQRYYNGATLETWVIPATGWRVIRGIEMPVRGGAIWRLPAGDFDYYRWEILDVEVNRPALWPASI